jgi:hypothetical protein
LYAFLAFLISSACPTHLELITKIIFIKAFKLWSYSSIFSILSVRSKHSPQTLFPNCIHLLPPESSIPSSTLIQNHHI